MEYSINNLTNMTDFDVCSINHDSQLSINNLGALQTILEYDHIVWFRHIRNYSHYLQYKGNLNHQVLSSILQKRQTDMVQANNITCLEKILTQEDVIQGYKSLNYKKCYSNFQDVFVFDIYSTYYDNLSFEEHLELHERLQQFIDLIYLNTTFILKINLSKTPLYNVRLNKNYDHEKYIFIKNKYNLTDNELYYLNIISISGSSKEIAKATGKSPRTIEKMIATLCKKLKIQNKFSLQIVAKILASNAGMTKLNTYKFELKETELEA